jgi:uncharacterized lipoprotein YddW (UPF0748 family)
VRAAALLSSVGLVALLLAFACSPDAAPPAPPGESPPVSAAPPPAPTAPAAAARPPTRLGLWVPAEGSVRPLDDARRIPALIATATALGATDLFVQVYRGGRAWFDSGVVDATPFRAARERSGVDPFARLLVDAHAAGLRVHAWINTLTLSTRRDAALLERLGPGAVQVDRRGRSVLDYPQLEIPEPDRGWYRMGTRQVWLDPADPAVAATLAAMAGDLVARYPALDGIHLDYIRYPDVLPFVPGSRFGVGLDFGYGAASRARFRAETGRVAPFEDSIANANAWDDWRRDRVTEVVERVAGAARSQRPDIELSAAVWAYADRAYLAIFQDWRGWLDEHLIDFAVPMAYTLDDRLLRYVATGAVHGVGGDRVWIGLGAWLFESTPERAADQLAFARSLDPAGVSLFSYDAIVGSPALAASLAPPRAAGGALPAAPSESAP